MDVEPSWLSVFRALGINLAILADFHSDSHPTDTGKIRLDEQKVYFEGCERFSDRDLLLMPGEEPDANFGGHYMFLFPRPLFFTHVKSPATGPAGQPFQETLAPYGKVYHTTTAVNELTLLNQEKGLVWQTHPRTKGSTGYPDAVRDKEFFQSDRYLGASFQSLPVDQSQKRLCEARCLGLLDDMNNWAGRQVHARRRRHLHEVPGRRDLPATRGELREARSRTEVQRGLDAGGGRAARRRLLRHQRRSAASGSTPSRARERSARIRRKRSGLSRPNSPNWYGATARTWSVM